MREWILLAAIPLAACGVAASGNDTRGEAATGIGSSRSFDIAGFTAVDLRGSDDVDVKVGSNFSVRAEGPSEELDQLEIRKDGQTLKVGRKDRTGISWGSRDGKGVKVFVTMPSIAGASVAGSGDMAVDRVAGSQFGGTVAGSGDLTVGRIAVDTASLSIAGSGGISVTGEAKRLSMSVAGSGDIDAPRLKAASADVTIAGSGGVTAEVDGPAKVAIMGSGDATLGARARCSTTKLGSGEVRCG